MAKILVIDDSPEVLNLLGTFLKEKGHDVAAAQEASDIAGLLAEHRPRLIILDYRMPGVNGAQALGRIRATPGAEKIPIIFLSGLKDYRVKVAVASSATERFLHKPVELSRLTALVDAMLGDAPGA